MNERTITLALASALYFATLPWAPPALATDEQPQPAASDLEGSRAGYEAMLEDVERARLQAEAARREAEHAARQARETAQRHAEQARLEAEQARLAQQEEAERIREAARLESQGAREAAEQQRREAEQLRRQAEEERERHRAIRREETERLQEELSRAHRELREATREIARAHREVARTTDVQHVVREFNLGERAVIGVILGPETPDGVKVVGVSPGGPAERAGLQSGDVILSIRGEPLGSAEGKAGRETLYQVMGETDAGETVAVVVDRDGESWTFDVTAEQREPASWQTLIRIPEAPLAPVGPGTAIAVPAAPAVPGAPPVIIEHVERIEIPDIDEEVLHERVQQMTEDMQTRKFLFVAPDGETFDGEFEFPESFDVEIKGYSELAEQALREANVWFGLPQAQGLELARVNKGLGAYFRTDRGVLVLEAGEDNAYRLEAGDVVLDVNDTAVNSPADLMRALREIEPGSEVSFAIKRDRKDKTLSVTMPENRLGYSWRFDHPAHPQAD
jgi:C-terminal processing protease CtpA/Prc